MQVTIHPTAQLAGALAAHGSKNYTSRHILCATLAHGVTELTNPAVIDDAQAMLACCQALGAQTTMTATGLRIVGTAGKLTAPGELNVGNAGAVARFLMAICAAIPAPTRFVTPYPDSLGRRPHLDLLTALRELGCSSSSNAGRLPITISGGLEKGGVVHVSGATSSQFTSALLFLAPLLRGTTHIIVTGEQRSAPLLDQTLRVLAATGIQAEAAPDRREFIIHGPQEYQGGRHDIPGDWPGTAAILAAAAVTESKVTITGLYDDHQGEQAIVPVLQAMGCDIHFDASAHTVSVRGGAPLHAVEFDGDKATDAVMAMVAAACFAKGTSRFYNIENLRYKESDRISDYCAELRKLGAQVEETRDSIIVHGQPNGLPGGATIEAHHDHRLLMGAAIASLRCRRPVVLNEAHHISKSYPAFFQDLQKLGTRMEWA
ncbi:MAG TPA: 3-phosphoshikimate 1-carboxyvinyltransferase [Firmicutes bacterium]|nr:3-phosphoshikimate 1-carboxyvinyltransferase [Bacillota bacterium]